MTDAAFHEHWRDIHARRWLIVVTALAAAAIAWGVSRAMTPVYEAKATFYLAANAPDPDPLARSGAAPVPLFPVPEEKAASLDVGILRGREVRARLAEVTGLDIGTIARRVDVTVSGEFMIDVFARDPDPAKAADLANAVPEVYRAFHTDSMRAQAAARVAAIESTLAGLGEERTAAEATLARVRADSASTADTGALERAESERTAAAEARAGLAADLARAEARAGAVDAALADEQRLYGEARTAGTSSALDAMLTRQLDLRVALTAEADGPASPRRLAIEGQIAEIDAAMAAERQRLAEATVQPGGSVHEELRLERVSLTAEIGSLTPAMALADARLTEAEARFRALLDASGEAGAASREIERIAAAIATAETALASARIAAGTATPPLVIVERAVPPDRAAFPLPVLNAVVAAVCGAILGLYYAMWIAQGERAAVARRLGTVTAPIFTADELRQIEAIRAASHGVSQRVSGGVA